MNLKTLKRLQKQSLKQLKRLGLAQLVIYSHILNADYDTATGKDVTQLSEDEILCFMSSFSRRELTNTVRATDVKCTIVKGVLEYLPIIDDVILWNEVEYDVVSFINDPAEATIELQIRAGA